MPTPRTPIIWTRGSTGQSVQTQPLVEQSSMQAETDSVQHVLTRGQRLRQAEADPVPPVETQPEPIVEEDEILRQLRTTQARISIWGLLASSSTHRDAMVRALTRIQVDSATSPEAMVHLMTADRASSIVFSESDLPPAGASHTRALYITVLCAGRRVSSVLVDNGSALDVCPLATAVALGYGPSDFETSLQTVRAYDSSRREVVGALTLDIQIGPITFSVTFQVLDIPASFSLLLARP